MPPPPPPPPPPHTRFYFSQEFRNKQIISISFYIKQPGKLDIILASEYSKNANAKRRHRRNI